MRPAIRIGAFVALSGALALGAVVGASRVRTGQFTLLQCLTHSYVEPGGPHQSLARFREADALAAAKAKVDIVFLGSSHAYAGFDPRIFAEAGYASMNLGSMNQTPLNTYYLAEHYLPLLAPAIVVFELFFPTLDNDGVESTRDLTVNGSWPWTAMKMARATWNLGALTFATATALGLTGDVSKVEQQAIAGETYISGGYCERTTRRTALLPPPDAAHPAITVALRPEQLDYLARTTALARGRGARVVWVSHPLPEDHHAQVPNRAALANEIAARAAASGVPYWNFDERMTLDPLEDFADPHHLNASGAAKFDRALIAELRR